MGEVDQDLVDAIGKEFNAWVRDGAQRRKFGAKVLLSSMGSSLKDKYGHKITKTTGFWASALAHSGINPDIFVSHKSKNSAENEDRLKRAIQEIAGNLGLHNLNDSNMNRTTEYVDLPHSLRRYHGSFPMSDSHGLTPKISLAAIQRRCFKAFGDWDTALKAAGIDPNEVKRRVPSHGAVDLLKMFDVFVAEHKGVWTVITLREGNNALFRAIGNSSRKNRIKFPYHDVSNEYVFCMWVYWRSWKETGSVEFEEKWWTDNSASLFNEYELNHRAQERWSLERIQEETLRLYSDGSNLDREDLNARGASNLIATARRISNSGGEAEIFARAGIFLAETRNLQRIMSDVPLEEVSNGLRELIKKSLSEKHNLLSREAMLDRNPELFYSALRWFNRLNHVVEQQNDWSKALKFFGLNPAVFELTASKRARRGVAFQRFFEELLEPYFEFVSSPERVVGDRQVSANKSYTHHTCHHETRCKPDFVFKNLIVDTKVGGSLAKPEQLKRYLDHEENVIVVTLNDREKISKIGDQELKIMSFRSFHANSRDILGVEFPSDSEQRLNEILRMSSLYSPEQ